MCESNNESHALITDEDAIATLEKAAMTRQTASYEDLRIRQATCFGLLVTKALKDGHKEMVIMLTAHLHIWCSILRIATIAECFTMKV